MPALAGLSRMPYRRYLAGSMKVEQVLGRGSAGLLAALVVTAVVAGWRRARGRGVGGR
jgi:membrane protein DedA with SNARE-associated domain